MSKTLLADLVERQVHAAVVATLSRSAERTAETMAEEILREPEFRDQMRTLVRAAFGQALVSLAHEEEREDERPR